MNLTYFVMIEMHEATHVRRGRIVGQLLSYINGQDYLSSDNLDTNRLFFNENAAKGISNYLSNHGEDEQLSAMIVGVPESFSIFDFEDEPIEDFEDVIDIYPNADARFNSVTGEFTRKTDTSENESLKIENKPIVFEKAAEIVKDFETIEKDTTIVRSDEETDLIKELLPTKSTLREIVNASLEIEDDNEFSEVIISQSESSLAIMQTLMSDDLAEVEDLDIDAINRRIMPKIKVSENAENYLIAAKVLDDFINNARNTEAEIRAQYQKDLDAYIAKVVEEVEREYRATVPDRTEENVNEYYESIATLYSDRSNERDRAKEALRKEIINEFVISDRSSVMKSLRKFLTLKEQIRQSAIAAIIRVKSREERKYAHVAPIETKIPSSEKYVEEPVVESNVYEEPIVETYAEPNEEVVESYEETHAEPNEEVVESYEEEPIEESNEVYEEMEHVEENTMKNVFEEEEKAEIIEDGDEVEDDMSLEEKVEISQVDISSLVATEDEEDAEDEEEDEEEIESPRRSKRKKKMGLGAKIGLSITGFIAVAALTFGGIAVYNNYKSNTNTQSTSQSSTKSKTIGDTVFNVGDALVITGQDGQSLDVKISEFKDDGSAVATDANGDLWLIRADQMQQYADSHPEQFKKDKNSSTSTSTEKKDESKSTDKKDESKSTDKKDESKSTDKKDESKSTDKKDEKSKQNSGN